MTWWWNTWWCGSRMLFIHLYFLHKHMVSFKSADWLVHWIYLTVYTSFKCSRWFQRKTSGCIYTSVFTWNCLIALHYCHCLEVSLEVELIVYWGEQWLSETPGLRNPSGILVMLNMQHWVIEVHGLETPHTRDAVKLQSMCVCTCITSLSKAESMIQSFLPEPGLEMQTLE